MSGWRERRVPEFQAYMRNMLGREPTDAEYAAAAMHLEHNTPEGRRAVGEVFHNRAQAAGGAQHILHNFDPFVLKRYHGLTPEAIAAHVPTYESIAAGGARRTPDGATHFFSPASMRAYARQDQSLVRSAVPMDVPGHGQVLVPSWATRAVAAGDFTNVDGQWFVTPNERYGRAPAEQSRDAEAQPGGFYGQATPAPPATATQPASQPPPAPRTQPEPPVAAQPAPESSTDRALRVAAATATGLAPQRPQQPAPDILADMPQQPRPRPRQLSARIPYMTAQSGAAPWQPDAAMIPYMTAQSGVAAQGQPARRAIGGGVDDGSPDARRRHSQETQVATFAGPNATTADREALARAQALDQSGAPREDIWRDTGWFKGRDGIWRFEIDDSAARWSGPGSVTREAAPAPNLDNLATRRAQAQKMFRTRTPDEITRATGLERHDGRWVQQRALDRITVAPALTEPAPLSRLWHHPELYKAYPEASNISVVPSSGLPGASGTYSDRAREMYVSPTAYDPRRIVLHEGQHFVQSREGTDQNSGADVLAGRLGDYRRRANEVEARATERRQNMTADQRRARPPWLDFDVPEDQQILGRAAGGIVRPPPTTSAPDIADSADWTERLVRQIPSYDLPAGRNLLPPTPGARAPITVVPSGGYRHGPPDPGIPMIEWDDLRDGPRPAAIDIHNNNVRKFERGPGSEHMPWRDEWVDGSQVGPASPPVPEPMTPAVPRFGAMPRRAEGGGIAGIGGAVDDTGSNVPETPEALAAQQRQLIEGRRPAQMFPLGSSIELPLPPGFDRVVTPRGVFHFDPRQISALDVVNASAAERENEVLGLGPMSKADVMAASRYYGEAPVAITERDRAGNEVRASLATPSTVPMQSEGILRSADPRHRVDVEPVENVVRDRMHPEDTALRLARADGGEVAGAPSYTDDEREYLDQVRKGIYKNRQRLAMAGREFGPRDYMQAESMAQSRVDANRGFEKIGSALLAGGIDLAGIPSAALGTIAPQARDIWRQAQEDSPIASGVGSVLVPGGMVGGIARNAMSGIKAGAVAAYPYVADVTDWASGRESRRGRGEAEGGVERAHGGEISEPRRGVGNPRSALDMYGFDPHEPTAEQLNPSSKWDRAMMLLGGMLLGPAGGVGRGGVSGASRAMPGGLGRPPLPRSPSIMPPAFPMTAAERAAMDRIRYEAHRSVARTPPPSMTMADQAKDIAVRLGIGLNTQIGGKTLAAVNTADHVYETMENERSRNRDAERQEGGFYGEWPTYVPHGNLDLLPQDLMAGGIGAATGSHRAAQEEGITQPNRRSPGSGMDLARLGVMGAAGYGTYRLMRGPRGIERMIFGPQSSRVTAGGLGVVNAGTAGSAYDYLFPPRSSDIPEVPYGARGSSVPSIGSELHDVDEDIPRFGARPPVETVVAAPVVVERASGGGIGTNRPIVGGIIGDTGGRADRVPATARAGSHVIPADVVAHLGQGNSMAGMKVLDRMFKTGPYGMALSRRRADGGEVGGGDHVPVMVSDGEYVIPPEIVAEIGGGDLSIGHEAFDDLILRERKKSLHQIENLPDPATD